MIIANNVMAHVPDLNGFVAGMAALLDDDGVITVENPYVRDLIEHAEFDTIYHEHFCYYSCSSVEALVGRHGMFLNHVEYFPNLHGGTLRWWIGKREASTARWRRSTSHAKRRKGCASSPTTASFASRVESIRAELLDLLRTLKRGRRPDRGVRRRGQGEHDLNSVGIGTDLLDFVVDRNVHKQGLLMPGVHIPIREPRGAPRRAARLRAAAGVELPGGDRSAAVRVPGSGRSVHRPRPRTAHRRSVTGP